MKPPMMVYVSILPDGIPNGVTISKDDVEDWARLQPNEPLYMYQLVKRVHPKPEKKVKKS